LIRKLHAAGVGNGERRGILAQARASYVIAIAGPVGAGKTTLAQAVAHELSDATILQFDHYERVTEQSIEQVRDWMEGGADLDAIAIPGLAEALQALKCRRSFKTDQLCALNFDQGLKPPVIGMAVDKCSAFSV
jgi:uridine kinase